MPTCLSDWLLHLEALHSQSMALPTLERNAKLLRVTKIAQSLRLLPVQLPVITVAGTNGKGSCVALLSSILHAAGYRVGTFTSPHLTDYRERIQINQRLVEEPMLLKAFEAIEHARGDQLLEYFTFTFLVSLWVFQQSNLDSIILEVGIGGRYDVVNLIDATIAVITSIALDHTEILGNNLASIAFEKAGIMRSGRPCVWGATNVEEEAKQYAQSLRTQLFLYGQDFTLEKARSPNSHFTTLTFTTGIQRLEALPTPNITHLSNAACALQAIQLLPSHLNVSEKAVYAGLGKVFVPGRFQIIPGDVTIVLDVAHNPASAQLLSENLQRQIKPKRILMVAAISKTKDIHGILAPLSKLAHAWYLGEFGSERCESAATLARCLDRLSVTQYIIVNDVCHAYNRALADAQPGDAVVVLGSFYTVGAIIQLRLEKQ